MAEKCLAAVVDFVRLNVDGLSLIHSQDNAFAVVDQLAGEMKPGDLALRAIQSNFPEELLRFLAESYLGKMEVIEFGTRIFELRNHPRIQGLPVVADILKDPIVYTYLLDAAPLKELARLVPEAPSDYWRRRFYRFVNNGDHERAWEELLRAWTWFRRDEAGFSIPKPTRELFIGFIKNLERAMGHDEVLKLLPIQPRALPRNSRAQDMLNYLPSEWCWVLTKLHFYFGKKRAARRRRKSAQRIQKLETV